MARCIECKYMSLQKDKTMSRHGFGFCTMTMATFYSLAKEHDCQMFTLLEKSKIDARIEWYENKRS
jgi:hypothetical protein